MDPNSSQPGPGSNKAAEAPPKTTQYHQILAVPVPFLGLLLSHCSSQGSPAVWDISQMLSAAIFINKS